MNLKNNLFNYATSELSQDAFLCWLASYALEDAEPDDTLRSCAREMLELFVPEFNGRPFTLTDVERQVWHIDALLVGNGIALALQFVLMGQSRIKGGNEVLGGLS